MRLYMAVLVAFLVLCLILIFEEDHLGIILEDAFKLPASDLYLLAIVSMITAIVLGTTLWYFVNQRRQR